MSTAVRHRTRLHHDQRAVLRRRRSHVSLHPVQEIFTSAGMIVRRDWQVRVRGRVLHDRLPIPHLQRDRPVAWLPTSVRAAA